MQLWSALVTMLNGVCGASLCWGKRCGAPTCAPALEAALRSRTQVQMSHLDRPLGAAGCTSMRAGTGSNLLSPVSTSTPVTMIDMTNRLVHNAAARVPAHLLLQREQGCGDVQQFRCILRPSDTQYRASSPHVDRTSSLT
jgi:hypothetical protein